MNKIIKIFLAIIGAIDAVVFIATPIAIAIFWKMLFGFGTGTTLITIMAFIATLFRGIKIGWLKD